MPTADGKPTAEDVAALLQTKPGATALTGQLDLIANGWIDLVNRVRNLEHSALVAAEADRRQDVTVKDYETRIAALEGDIKHDRSRIDSVEKTPADNTKRFDDLEKRVRTVEGAVGSAGYKAAKDAPANPEPFRGPDATEPLPESKPAETKPEGAA